MWIIIVLSTFLIHSTLCAPVEFAIHKKWQYFNKYATKARNQNSWILLGILEFKKKKTDALFFLNKLIFQWKGDHLSHLHAALYKKMIGEECFPFQEHLISESKWDQQNQKIIFNFHHALALEAETSIFLVLTTPSDKIPILEKGHFEIEYSKLPFFLQQSFQDQPLILSYK